MSTDAALRLDRAGVIESMILVESKKVAASICVGRDLQPRLAVVSLSTHTPKANLRPQKVVSDHL